LISLMTSPVLGSIRLTGDAAPCEPNWFSMARKRADFADRLYWGEAPILGFLFRPNKKIFVVTMYSQRTQSSLRQECASEFKVPCAGLSVWPGWRQ
jgi:hypothetical protein